MNKGEVQMKKFLAALLALAMIPAMMAGCSKKAASADTSAKSSQKANLTFMWWGSQVRHDATIKATQLYTQQHPNVTFTNVYQSFDGYFDKLSMLAAANNLPDVFQFTVGQATGSEFIDKNFFEPLVCFVSIYVIVTSFIGSSALSTGKLDNKLYGLILGTNALGLVVDPSAYQKAGLTVPENGYASWEDIGKDLQKLKAVEGQGGYGADDILWLNTIFGYWCNQYGEHAYDSKKVIGFSEKTYVDYMNLVKSWIDQGLITPLDIAQQVSSVPANSELAKHKAAMNLIYTNNFASLSQAFGGELQLIPLPPTKSGKGPAVVASQHIVMASTSKNKDAAAKFMSFFVNDTGANKILNAERGLPAPSKVLEALKPGFTPTQKQTADYLEKINKTAGPVDPPAPASSQNIYTLLDDLQQQIVYGKITPEAAYKKVQEQAKQDMATS